MLLIANLSVSVFRIMHYTPWCIIIRIILKNRPLGEKGGDFWLKKAQIKHFSFNFTTIGSSMFFFGKKETKFR